MVELFTLGFTLALPSSVALVAQNVVSDWPALFALDPRVQNHVAVLALKTLRMKIFVHRSDPRCFGLSFLWYDWLCADAAKCRKFPCVAIWTIHLVCSVRGERLSFKGFATGLAVEAIGMKDAARNTDGVPINILVTFRALVHVTHVILLAEHLVIQLIIGAFYHLLAHAANLLGLLEIFFANWFVLKEEVGISQWLIADMTLHAAWMIIGIVVHHAVPHYLLFAHTALLLTSLVAFGTKSVFILREELPIEFFLTTVTAEAILVENLPKSSATIIRKIALAVIAGPCRFVHCFYCPVSDSRQDLRVTEILTGWSIA